MGHVNENDISSTGGRKSARAQHDPKMTHTTENMYREVDVCKKSNVMGRRCKGSPPRSSDTVDHILVCPDATAALPRGRAWIHDNGLYEIVPRTERYLDLASRAEAITGRQPSLRDPPSTMSRYVETRVEAWRYQEDAEHLGLGWSLTEYFHSNHTAYERGNRAKRVWLVRSIISKRE